MDTGTSRYPRDDIRVSDADRDEVVSELSEHFQSGRITQDEFDERSGLALQARTGADLNALFTDLPPRTAVAVPSVTGGDLEPDGYGSPPAVHHFPLGRVILALVVLSIVTGNVVTIGHAMFGWLIPVVIIAFILLRSAGHRRH
jgi:hypothetical protein